MQNFGVEILLKGLLDMEYKVCKECGIEKPVGEFSKSGKQKEIQIYNARCKVCDWFQNKNIKYTDSDKRSFKIDYFIVDNLLNKKIKYINEIAEKIDKSLIDVCLRINNVLKIGGSTTKKIILKCPNCNENFESKIHVLLDNHKNNFCSKTCCNEYQTKHPNNKPTYIDKVCELCGKEFAVTLHRKKQKYCSMECSNKSKENKIKTKCVICGEVFIIKKSLLNKKKTCSEECSRIYNKQIQQEKSIGNRVNCKCEECGKIYNVIKSQYEKGTKFCSLECRYKWQSKNIVGENHPNYNSVIIKCQWCGKDVKKKRYKVNSGQYLFCSRDCYREWFAKDYSQTKEWRDQRRIIAVESLENNLVPTANTSIQNKLNLLLDEMNIEYTNEKGFKYYSIDNYLPKYNLCIEVMGSYWHCDRKHYSEIKYEMQLDRILKDKNKRNYLNKHYNMNILYLWEDDINENIEKCKQLIKFFIDSNGELKNYHSFNYCYDSDIKLKEYVLKPYMELKLEEILANLYLKEDLDSKVYGNHIIFRCNNCNNTTVQRLKEYTKNNNHYCCRECYHEDKKTKNKAS